MEEVAGVDRMPGEAGVVSGAVEVVLVVEAVPAEATLVEAVPVEAVSPRHA